MSIPSLKPFGSPVPGQTPDVVTINTRGNDNVLRTAINSVDDAVDVVESMAIIGMRAVTLFDPRLDPPDGDSIMAARIFSARYLLR